MPLELPKDVDISIALEDNDAVRRKRGRPPKWSVVRYMPFEITDRADRGEK